MMKYFCYIFSLYFLALSVMPCSDIHDMNSSAGTELASISADEHSNCPHEKQDFCSPFCDCACCGMTINFQVAFHFTTKFPSIPLPIVSENFSYQSPNSLQYLQAVFQPPQIG